MTQTEAYDLACACKRFKEPAAIMMGDICVIGDWVSCASMEEGFILHSQKKGVLVMGQGSTWEEAAVRAGIVRVPESEVVRPSIITHTRMVTLPDVAAALAEIPRDLAPTPQAPTTQPSTTQPSPPQAPIQVSVVGKALIIHRGQPTPPEPPRAPVCDTYGCGETIKPGNTFCPKCFQEHNTEEGRDERDIHPPTKR